jgi:hypothetical protein
MVSLEACPAVTTATLRVVCGMVGRRGTQNGMGRREPHMSRIVIAGVPHAGKSTLGQQLGKTHDCPVYSTDSLRHLPWTEQSAAVAHWFERPGSWVIEGVASVRGLRKALEQAPTPCDVVLWLGEPRTELTRGQRTLAKGCETIFAGIRHDLEARGVAVRDLRPDRPTGQTRAARPARKRVS